MKGKIRWFILALVFVATGLSFLDRQVLSMTIIKIQEELNITDVQYGVINTGFLISYALMFTIAGRLIDKIGAKLGLTLSVAIWSIASVLHGVMSGFYHLLMFRFLLGVGEGGCFPGAAKTVYEWFGKRERALANGIAIGGSAIGAVVAPPLTIIISGNYGWRWAFIIPGVFGVLWVLVWGTISWRKKRADKQQREVNVPLKRAEGISFLEIIKNRSARVFVLMRLLLDPVFYFLMFWVPKYLSEERGLSFDRIGELFWIPFMALGISNIIGGWISDTLIAKNLSVNAARKWVMGIAALLTLIAPFITRVSSVELAVGFMAIMMLAHGFWITNYVTAISDIFGKYATSTVVGLSGTAGAIAGMLVNPIIGMVVQKYSYAPLWWVAGIMYPLAFIIMVMFIPNLNPITVRHSIKVKA
ncbi:MFS transporter [Echinicola vietnamensis]|uniref:Sugar phosphate permease n=1 Tax=Echinicola vietnamensis (strain DSM 17526 / LMG 23754 / KMM 6221) TaxID=926556 RepID=L0FTS2_ECHVK|nr:MFS transporter [Echinicola vietnamensis]AGA76697.1 sugar phosphate permease [Echinicola vietnamensis DSM 17526]